MSAPVDPRPRTPIAARFLPSRFYYGWYVAIAMSLVMMAGVGVGFYGLAVFLKPLQDAHGWSNTAVSGATALVGPHVDRRGPIPFLIAGLILTALATALVGLVNTLWQLYLVYALLALGFGLAGGVSMNAIMTRWFVRRRAQAMSISATGISVAGVVLPPLGAVLIAAGGLELTAPIFGLVIALSVPIVVLVMVWDPSQMGLRPDGHEPPPEDTTEAGALSDLVQRRRWSIREVTRTVPFWAVVIAFTLVLMSQTGFLIHQIAFLEERMGSRTAASLALSTAAFGSIVARLVVGTFADRLNKRRLTAGLFVLQGTAVLLLTFIENDATTYLFTLLFGFTFGNVYMMQSLLVGEIFGLVSFGTVFGLVSFAGQTSSGLGPLLVGLLEDSTGSYTIPFTVTALVTFGGALIVLRARPVPVRRPTPGVRR